MTTTTTTTTKTTAAAATTTTTTTTTTTKPYMFVNVALKNPDKTLVLTSGLYSRTTISPIISTKATVQVFTTSIGHQ